jgi:hypothetical protein
MSPGLVLDNSDCPELPDPIKQKNTSWQRSNLRHTGYALISRMRRRSLHVFAFPQGPRSAHTGQRWRILWDASPIGPASSSYTAETRWPAWMVSRIPIGETTCRGDRRQASWLGTIARQFSGAPRCKRQWLCPRRRQNTTRHRRWPLRSDTYATSSEICA